MSHNFTSAWLWPQWTVVIYLILIASIVAVKHGQDKVTHPRGEQPKPQKYNAFVTFLRIIVVVGVLIAGGFFR